MQHGLRYIAKQFVSTEAEKLIDLVGKKSLNIPHHQRDYSWEKTEVSAFLKDVEKLRAQNFEELTALGRE
jgi:uncharacterized protein with ParB-like and HNH nuclease domain